MLHQCDVIVGCSDQDDCALFIGTTLITQNLEVCVQCEGVFCKIAVCRIDHSAAVSGTVAAADPVYVDADHLSPVIVILECGAVTHCNTVVVLESG